MAESIHMLELPIEIEPLRPRPKRWSPFMPDVGVSAAVVEFCARIAAALRKLFKDFAGPPMEVGIDDPHAGHSVLAMERKTLIIKIRVNVGQLKILQAASD